MENKLELIKKSYTLKQQKDHKGALDLLKRALELEDNKTNLIELLFQIAELSEILGDDTLALEYIQKILSYEPNNIGALEYCYRIYMRQNKTEKAKLTAQKMFDIEKTQKSVLCYLDYLKNANKIDEIFEIFNNLPEELKLDTEILYLISKVSPEEKQELILEKIIDLDEVHQKANLDLIKIKLKHKNYNEVTKYALNLDENTPFANYYLGLAEAKKNNYPKAIELLTKAIIEDKDEHDFWLDLIRCYIDTASFLEASLALKKSINISLIRARFENLDEKQFLLGWLLIKQNDPEGAISNLSSIKQNSKFYNQAQILMQSANLEGANLALAKSNLEKYLKDDPYNIVILDTLALIYKELKFYKESFNMFNRALHIYPESIYYRLEIIDLLIDLGDWENALNMIENFEDKNCASIYNSKTRIYYRKKDLNTALSSIDSAIKLDLNNSEYRYFRGLILNDLNRFEEARATIYDAIKLNPQIAKYYSQMARSYTALGQYEDALLYAKEAIDLNEHEINFKKQAYEIALKTKDQNKISLYKRQLERSEKILRMSR